MPARKQEPVSLPTSFSVESTPMHCDPNHRKGRDQIQPVRDPPEGPEGICTVGCGRRSRPIKATVVWTPFNVIPSEAVCGSSASAIVQRDSPNRRCACRKGRDDTDAAGRKPSDAQHRQKTVWLPLAGDRCGCADRRRLRCAGLRPRPSGWDVEEDHGVR